MLFWRGNSPLKAVGYENAGYGNSAHRKRNSKAGFGREDCNRDRVNDVKLVIIMRHTSIRLPESSFPHRLRGL